MQDAIIAAGESLMERKDVRAVVLSGEGRSFCAGLDTASFARAPDPDMWSGHEEEPTPLQSTIVSVANVCAAHPSPPFTSPQVAATSPYIETKLEDGSPVAIVVAEQPPVALAPMIGHMKARMAQLKDWLQETANA